MSPASALQHVSIQVYLYLQIANLVARASKNETKGGVETALLLTTAQAKLLAEVNAASGLKELGLNASPRVVINLIGDVTRDMARNPERIAKAEAQLFSFMQRVNGCFFNR